MFMFNICCLMNNSMYRNFSKTEESGSIPFLSLAVIMFVYLLIRKKIDDIIMDLFVHTIHKHSTNRKTIMLLVNTVNEASQAKIFFLVDNQKSFPPTSDSGLIVVPSFVASSVVIRTHVIVLVYSVLPFQKHMPKDS